MITKESQIEPFIYLGQNWCKTRPFFQFQKWLEISNKTKQKRIKTNQLLSTNNFGKLAKYSDIDPYFT